MQVILLKDIDNLGYQNDVVKVKNGFGRNYLEYKALAASLEGKKLNIAVKAGTSGKIFGSVTSVQIAQALTDQCGVEVPRKKIILPEAIKEIGTYTATVQFSKEVAQEIEFDLIQD